MLTTLPSQGIGTLSAQAANQADKRVQSRPDTPHKNLPAPKDLLDEGKGLKTTKAKDAPPKPPSLCRYRDVACLENQRKNGGKISFNAAPTASPEPSQSASAAPKSEGN